jgi:TfoX/Sxy family transcriptional regulator of competence genes
MGPFKPYADRPMSMSYYRVPVSVLEDASELTAWARAAIQVAKASTKKPRARKTHVARRKTATR